MTARGCSATCCAFGGTAGEGAIADRRLIINADDLGLSPGVNRGIFEAYAAGAVTSASLLVNAPGLADAVTRLRASPNFPVGLHLNLTDGQPVARLHDVSSLCDPRTRKFYRLPQLIVRALLGRIARDHVVTECGAQLSRLRELGVSVGHIDSHRHVHALPVVWSAVMEVVARTKISAIRIPEESSPRRSMRLGRALAAASLRAAWRLTTNGHSNDRRLSRADHFWGFGLLGAPDFQRRLLVLLDQLEPGTTELMVHPGYVDRELAAWDSYTTPRERELAGLCSREVRERLTRGDLQLVT